MTDERDKTQEQQQKKDENSSCMDMMAKMMGQSGEGVSCESIISQVMNEDEIPEDWLQKMSTMEESVSSCCGAPAEIKRSE